MNFMLKGKKIGFGITGSFCTVNLVKEILQDLVNEGVDVYPVLSDTVVASDTRFSQAKDYIEEIESITGKKCVTNIVEAEEFGPITPLDLMVIVPISGVSIAKFANAINDNAPLLSAKATLRNDNPVLLGVFTNDGLGLCGVNIMQLMATKNVFMLPFGQNDPIKKSNSITSDLSKTKEAIILALQKKQIQPVLVENFK
jgi:dipicolinate synthase subunit B